jgi:hypothetical protein
MNEKGSLLIPNTFLKRFDTGWSTHFSKHSLENFWFSLAEYQGVAR